MPSTQPIRPKSPDEIEAMAAAGRDLAEVFRALRSEGIVRPGVRARDVDRTVEGLILDQGNLPAFKGYHGFPGSACISIGEVVVHGIPGDRRIEDGDIVGVDIGLVREGWHADSAETICVGEVSEEAERLCRTTAEALASGIEACRAGNTLADIGRAVERHARENGYGLVESLAGHGIGRDLHEEPQVFNYESLRRPNLGLEVGWTLAIEPMFNLGTGRVRVLEDEWTIVTLDSKWSAHFEHTVAITEDGPRVLTAR